MKLSLVREVDASKVLTRLDPLDISSFPPTVLAHTRQLFGEGVTPEQSVVRIVREVRNEGDAAVRRYAKLLDGVDPGELQVSEDQMAEARRQVSPSLREAPGAGSW